MRVLQTIQSWLLTASLLCVVNADIRARNNASSRPDPSCKEFVPPPVFSNVEVVRNTNLEKSWVRETIHVRVENIAKDAQSEYYLSFPSSQWPYIGGVEVTDKVNSAKGPFQLEAVDPGCERSFQYIRVRLPEPVAPKQQQMFTVSYSSLSPGELSPLPATIAQTDQQFLQYNFSIYASSPYVTQKQRTNLKVSAQNVPDFAKISGKTTSSDNKEDPVRDGTTFTYGPFGEKEPGAYQEATIRYEYTRPIVRAADFERDMEVSHWGGNLATEERYILYNAGAKLSKQFNRIEWAMASLSTPKTWAIREMKYPLAAGSTDPYFVDDIGNVSTSHFRKSSRDALLELKPRYPIFGGWQYKFKLGWNRNLGTALRKLANGDGHALRVPFIEGPRLGEGIVYENVVVRAILPEGATNVRYETTVPLTSTELITTHTFMDTVGRTTLILRAENLPDDFRERDLVILYDYPAWAGYRKPVTIAVATFSIFAAAYVLGMIDISIGKSK